MQATKIDVKHLCATAKGAGEEDKLLIRKRDLKTLEKYICVQKLNPVAFERTVEEIKFRYYEVARAVL